MVDNTFASPLRQHPLETLVGQLFGNASDPTRGRQMPNHYGQRDKHILSVSSPVASQLLHAVGIALAAKLRAGDPLAQRITPGKSDFVASLARALRALPAPKSAALSAALRASPADHAEIAAIVRAAGTSFAKGMQLLPRPRR